MVGGDLLFFRHRYLRAVGLRLLTAVNLLRL
jgi:hypothetical protein